MTDAAYRVQEATGNPDHPTVDDVIHLALQRAASPRREDHPDGHFDRYVRDAIEEHGESAVTTCIQSTLVDGLTHRTAGAAAFGDENYQHGINVGVAASTYLRELHGERTPTP